MFGLNKLFVIFLVLSLAIGYYTNWLQGFVIFGIFVIVKFIWNILTQ